MDACSHVWVAWAARASHLANVVLDLECSVRTQRLGAMKLQWTPPPPSAPLPRLRLHVIANASLLDRRANRPRPRRLASLARRCALACSACPSSWDHYDSQLRVPAVVQPLDRHRLFTPPNDGGNGHGDVESFGTPPLRFVALAIQDFKSIFPATRSVPNCPNSPVLLHCFGLQIVCM